MLRETTAIGFAALPLAALKEHLRLGSAIALASDQDALLESHLRAAIAVIEGRIGKALLERSYELRLTHWLGEAQPLPIAPVSEITEVVVCDAAGEESLWPSSRTYLVVDLHRPKLVGLLPNIPLGGHVLIRFEAGFGSQWSAVPADLRQAVFMLAAQFYEYRQGDGGENALPKEISALIERWRQVRVLGGGYR